MNKKVIKVDFKKKTNEAKNANNLDEIARCLLNYFATEDKNELKKLSKLLSKNE